MSAPQQVDLVYTRGTTPQLVTRFKKQDVAIPFDDARLTVTTNGGSLLFRLTVEDGTAVITDPDNGEVTFYMTAAQTRKLAQSGADGAPKNKYEVEIRNGTDEQVYLAGGISGLGGINDDESVS